MNCILAEHRINILDVKYLHDDEYAVIFEYCYINKSGSKVWAKDVTTVVSNKLGEVIKNGKLNEALINSVNWARAELKK